MENIILGVIGVSALAYFAKLGFKNYKGENLCQCSSVKSCDGKCCSKISKEG